MNQRAVRRMTKRRMVVTELNEDDPGSGAWADPRDRRIAVWIIRAEQRFDVRRNEQPFVGFVSDMERAETRDDGMIAHRSDHVFLAELHPGIGDRALTLQSIKPAHHFLVPPRPLLEIENP